MILSSMKQQRKSHYRSIQYRSVSSDIKSNKIDLLNQKLPIFQIRRPQFTRNEARKSKKTLFKSEQNLKHLNKSLTQSLSKAFNQKQLQSTLVSQFNPQQHLANTFGTETYLQTFSQLMQLQEGKKQYTYRKMGPISQKLKALKDKNKLDRISLPNIIEYQNSQFSALDPINIPILSIKENIQKTRKQIYPCPNQMNSIRCDMRQYKQSIIKDLDNYKVQFLDEIKKLRLKLSSNSVYHHSFLLNCKRQLTKLQQFIPEYKNEFHETNQKQRQLQKAIFQTQPFELSYNNAENKRQYQQGQKLFETINNVDNMYF